MDTIELKDRTNLRISQLADHIIGSEIIKIAGEINEKIKKGEKIFNLTIGDFDPNIFPIPDELKNAIIAAYAANQTNYPAAEGMYELRKAVSDLLKSRGGLDFQPDQILIAGGARPIIYTIFRALVDPGDTVIFPVPSWNNNHYTYLNGAHSILIETKAENGFMPVAEEIKPHIHKATLIALCSPLNPTGTVFTKEGLTAICDLILTENKRRGPEEKPLYLMYDQIYWALTYGTTRHYDPVSLRPEMKEYTVYVDGISKSLAATGLRIGWSMGPTMIIGKMKSILSHVGAWAPKAEQVATAKFLNNLSWYDSFLAHFREQLNERLMGFYNGFQKLKNEGFNVNPISPQAAIYLTVQFSLLGQKTENGKVLRTARDITKYILDEAMVGLVPFYTFGSREDSTMFRLSVGTCKTEDIASIIDNLRKSLQKLKS
jgi:aspartate aminotransferase